METSFLSSKNRFNLFKMYSKFTDHPCGSETLKLYTSAWVLSVNLLHIFRTSFHKSTSGRLLPTFVNFSVIPVYFLLFHIFNLHYLYLIVVIIIRGFFSLRKTNKNVIVTKKPTAVSPQRS